MVEWHGTRPFRIGEIVIAVESGTTLAIAGASGSGKSTLLDLVAGLRRPDRGSVRFDGTDLARTPPERRDVALVTQDAALYDDETVGRNLDLVLHARGIRARDRPSRIDATLAMLGVAHLRDATAGACSGGERRRVALAKALARAPRVLLLDEPFAGLDPARRRDVRTALRHAIARCKPRPTVLVASHDIDDALVLADRLAVLDDGRLAQLGATRDVIAHPATHAVAIAVTNPPGAFLPVELERVGDGAIDVRGPGIAWSLRDASMPHDGPDPTEGSRAMLFVPIDALSMGPAGGNGSATLTGWTAVDEEPAFRGSEILLTHSDHSDSSSKEPVLRAWRSEPGSAGGDRNWSVRLDRVHLFDAESGERVPFAIDAR